MWLFVPDFFRSTLVNSFRTNPSIFNPRIFGKYYAYLSVSEIGRGLCTGIVGTSRCFPGWLRRVPTQHCGVSQ